MYNNSKKYEAMRQMAKVVQSRIGTEEQLRKERKANQQKIEIIYDGSQEQ